MPLSNTLFKSVMFAFPIETAYDITIGLLLLSTLMSGLELASVPVLYTPFIFPGLDLQKHYRQNQLWLLGQTLLSALTLLRLFYGNFTVFRVCFTILGGIVFYTYKKRSISRNGSDQIRILAYVVIIFCFVLEPHYARLLPMYFLGGQILIAYATSGIAKVCSPLWRRGDVLSKVLSTFSFGIPAVAGYLVQRPVLEKALSFAAIAIMIAVPACFFIPAPAPLLVALALMFSFHFSTAILMGLNDFLITFPLGYPGVFLLHALFFQ